MVILSSLLVVRLKAVSSTTARGSVTGKELVRTATRDSATGTELGEQPLIIALLILRSQVNSR